MASDRQLAIWSRRPRDPSNAPTLIIHPKTNPPEHIYHLAFSDITPPASPQLSPRHLSSEISTEPADTPAGTTTPATTVPTSPASTSTSIPPQKEEETSVQPVQPAQPSSPPPKKTWASLLQSNSSAGPKKNQLPTSSIVGFSVPASAMPSTSGLTPEKRSALTALLNGTVGHPLEIYIRPRGLTNTGNMCFANSVLQVLLYCEPFWRLFARLDELLPPSFADEALLLRATASFIRDFVPPSRQNKNKRVNGKITGARSKGKEREIAEEDWDEHDAFIPNYVYDALKSKKRFETLMGVGGSSGYQAQEDAEEFLGFYLDTLEEELLAVAERISPSRSSQVSEAVEETEEEGPSETDDGWLEVGKKNRTVVTRTIKNVESPISRVFGGKFRSTLRAPGQKDSVMVEDWRSLRVDIQADFIHTIEDALAHISHPQPIQMSHPTLPGSTLDASQQVLIEALPPVLVVHLKRFCYDISAGGVMKVSKQVTFKDELTIPSEILAPSAKGKNRSTRYKLFSVIYHHGVSATGGHYTLDVLHPNRFPAPQNSLKGTEATPSREGWIRIDDELVSDVRHADIFASTAFERDDAACRCAYMLFYKRIR